MTTENPFMVKPVSYRPYARWTFFTADDPDNAKLMTYQRTPSLFSPRAEIIPFLKSVHEQIYNRPARAKGEAAAKLYVPGVGPSAPAYHAPKRGEPPAEPFAAIMRAYWPEFGHSPTSKKPETPQVSYWWRVWYGAETLDVHFQMFDVDGHLMPNFDLGRVPIDEQAAQFEASEQFAQFRAAVG